jgi:multicomponent Na+:H+ antiporter subunit F
VSHGLGAFSIVVPIVLAMLSVALLLAFVRLLRGPSLADRVVAFDLLTLLVLGIVLADAVLTDQWVFLDAAILLALVTFIATVAFGRHLEKRAREARQTTLLEAPRAP